MPDFKIVLSGEAQANIGSIYDWISQRSLQGANRWYRTLQGTLDSLKDSADHCAVAPESRHFLEVIRSVTFRMRSGRTYRVLFTIDGTQIHVLYVRGPGQDFLEP